jgi:hypothetical protein
MQCPRCKQENREGRRFCAECGASLALPCQSCGFSNEPGEKFCGGCGTQLEMPPRAAIGSRFSSPESYTPKHLIAKILTSKPALEGERKQVTVLFADLKSSMELLADRDPEDARALLDPVVTLMMEAVHQYEGTVNQVMGDGIMALFGAPLAHEDHAVRACYAALDMQQQVKRYAEDVTAPDRAGEQERDSQVSCRTARPAVYGPARRRRSLKCTRRFSSARCRHKLETSSSRQALGSPQLASIAHC